jgi:predicted N-acetyltransferase YhbS
MNYRLRQPTASDKKQIGQLVFDAFASIDDRHAFARDFPSVDAAMQLADSAVGHAGVYGIVAERDDGRIVACNFLDERNSVPGVGPVCVDPAMQGGGVGRAVMRAVLDRADKRSFSSVRLVQDAFNLASLSLYASLEFDVKEPLAQMLGTPPPRKLSAGMTARYMTAGDLQECAELCRRIHGFDRSAELADALTTHHPVLLERDGRVTGYLSAPSLYIMNHAVAETDDDMIDLLCGAAAMAGQLSFTVPTRNSRLFRWCLEQRIRIVKPMTLMVRGDYHAPKGAWMPSVSY